MCKALLGSETSAIDAVLPARPVLKERSRMNKPMNEKLHQVLSKHKVELFAFEQTGAFQYTLKTDKPAPLALAQELTAAFAPFIDIVFETLPEQAQPLLPGMGPSLVSHPAHYNSGKIEVIEAIEDWKLSYHRGNAVKYVARAGRKDPTKEIEDLEKAVWYLKREIERLTAIRENREPTRPNDMNPKMTANTSVTDVSNLDRLGCLMGTALTAKSEAGNA